MSQAAAALLALAGNFVLSLGMVLQKRHVGWLGRKGGLGRESRRDRRGWTAGFVLMNLAPVFNYFALLGLAPNVVAAMIGSSVAFTTLLAALVLKERIGARRLCWTGGLFAALALAGLRGEAAGASFSPAALAACAALPPAAGLLLAAARERRRRRGADGQGGGGLPASGLPRRGLSKRGLAAALAAAAGAAGGSMVLSMRAVQLSGTGSPLSWFGTPYLYGYAVAGIAAFALIQLAYKDGEMSSVSPVFYGMQVLWPALSSYAVFAAPFDLVEALSFGAIALAILFISRSR
ncbi:MAG TPA: hypothetical protein P5165_05620 [Spirochaetia bacterium]|nr:hypothetical protein [Spirochaetia bacterium]